MTNTKETSMTRNGKVMSAIRQRRIDSYREAREAYISTPYGAYASRKRCAHDDVLQWFAERVYALRLEGIDERDLDAQDGITDLLPIVPRSGLE